MDPFEGYVALKTDTNPAEERTEEEKIKKCTMFVYVVSFLYFVLLCGFLTHCIIVWIYNFRKL